MLRQRFNLDKFPDFIQKELLEFPREILLLTPMGSRLHGTNVKDSDYDYWMIYLPSEFDLAMCIRPEINATIRFNPDGSEVEDRSQVQAGGYEIKPVSVIQFLEGYMNGHPEAVEAMSSIRAHFMPKHVSPTSVDAGKLDWFLDFLMEFAQEMRVIEVRDILSFAKKNFEFIQKRNQRLITFQTLYEWVSELLDKDPDLKNKYLVEDKPNYSLLLKLIVDSDLKGVKINAEESNSDNGRLVIFEKPVAKRWTWDSLHRHLGAKVGEYGNRVRSAQELGFDPKGIAHGARCCLEVADILKQGYITFPLAEAETVKMFKTASEMTEELQTKFSDLFAYANQLISQIPHYDSKLGSARDRTNLFLTYRLPRLFRLLLS